MYNCLYSVSGTLVASVGLRVVRTDRMRVPTTAMMCSGGGKGGGAKGGMRLGRHCAGGGIWRGENAEFGNSAASGVDVINYRYHRHICTEKCNTVKLLVKERGKV